MMVLTALSYPTITLLTIHLSTARYTPLYHIEGLPLSLTTTPTAVPTIPISFRTTHMVARTLHTRFKTLPTASLQPTSRATLCCKDRARRGTAGLPRACMCHFSVRCCCSLRFLRLVWPASVGTFVCGVYPVALCTDRRDSIPFMLATFVPSTRRPFSRSSSVRLSFSKILRLLRESCR
jgi:hypothetical protein